MPRYSSSMPRLQLEDGYQQMQHHSTSRQSLLLLSHGDHPHRFFYPSTEQSLNGESFKQAVSEQGEDEITTRLWFDVADKKR